MFRRLMTVAGIGVAVLGVSGCALLKTAAIRTVADTLSESGSTVTAHDDPELVADALPFALILNESLLASAPRHTGLLTATCGQYTQYAFGFVLPRAEEIQFDRYSESKRVSQRALTLALRGQGYCWRALEVRFPGATTRLARDPATAIRGATKTDVPLLYWSAASLGAAISVGGLDRPDLLIHWPLVRTLAEQALALDESWSAAAAHELMITVESQGEALGGSEARARAHFARAVELQRGRLPGPYLSLALGVTRSRQDAGEFRALLDQALAIDPHAEPASRLATLVTQRRARMLLDHIDDIFLR